MIRKLLALIGLPLAVILTFYLSRWVLQYVILGLHTVFSSSILLDNPILSNLVISIISYAIILAILSFLPIKLLFGPKPSDSADPAESPKRADIVLQIILAISGFLVYLLLSTLINNIFSNFSWYNAGQEQEIAYSSASGVIQIILSGIALILVTPYFEEAIFRGWLYGNLRKLRISGILSALAVSLAFAFLHGQLNVGIDTFALSLICCYLYEQTGSIRSGVLLHMIKNSVAFFFLFFAK